MKTDVTGPSHAQLTHLLSPNISGKNSYAVWTFSCPQLKSASQWNMTRPRVTKDKNILCKQPSAAIKRHQEVLCKTSSEVKSKHGRDGADPQSRRLPLVTSRQHHAMSASNPSLPRPSSHHSTQPMMEKWEVGGKAGLSPC